MFAPSRHPWPTAMAVGADLGGDLEPPPGPAPPSESRDLRTPRVLPRPASFQLDWRDIVRDTDSSTGRPRKLGSGAFGVVYAAKLKRDMDTLVALKILQWSGDEGLRRKQHESFSREVEVWQTLTDDHVLRFLGYTVDPYLTLVSEVAETDLASLLQGPPRPTFPWVDAQRCLLHVARGMRHLHSKDIVHCDLKPANILRRNGIYKVADFGLSAFRDSAFGGTSGYLAPEALLRDLGPRGLPSDVYSYGIIAHELNVGQCPDLPGCLVYRSGSPLRRPFGITDAMWNLIESCTDWEPLERPDFRAIIDTVEHLTIVPMVDRIILQVGNGTYGADGDPKNLPMATDSVDLLNTVLTSFYGFSGGLNYNQSAAEIRRAASAAVSDIRTSSGTSLIHLVGHGGDRNGRFVFEGACSPDAIGSGEVNTVDLEHDILARIPKDHAGLVVALLDCCRGAAGEEDRPFEEIRPNVLLGFAASHNAKAYGCLYSFLVAEELWRRFNRQSAPFSWRSALDAVQKRIIKRTNVAALQQDTKDADLAQKVQQVPEHMPMSGEINWTENRFLLKPLPKTATEASEQESLRLSFERHTRELEETKSLEQSYPLASYMSYMSDLFDSPYRLELIFSDGSSRSIGGDSGIAAGEMLLQIHAMSSSPLTPQRIKSFHLQSLKHQSRYHLPRLPGSTLFLFRGFAEEAIEQAFGGFAGPETATGSGRVTTAGESKFGKRVGAEDEIIPLEARKRGKLAETSRVSSTVIALTGGSAWLASHFLSGANNGADDS
ncbi:kinase-like domain-containing protein [Hyaloraphidium curvatum]|nr:kinase-like domain-containing protein [Hyaloraphidium curvatum]